MVTKKSESNNSPEATTETTANPSRLSAKERFKQHVKEQGGSAFMSLETEQWRLELQMLNRYLNAKYYRQALQSEEVQNAITPEARQKKANDVADKKKEEFYQMYPEVEVENRKIDYPFLKEVVWAVTTDWDEDGNVINEGTEDIPTKVLEPYIQLEEEKREKLRIRNNIAQQQSPTAQASNQKSFRSSLMADAMRNTL